MSMEKYILELRELFDLFPGDTEMQHVAADQILCKALEELGQKDLVQAYKEIPKWYA